MVRGEHIFSCADRVQAGCCSWGDCWS